MSSESTPPRFLRLHRPTSRANDGSNSEPARYAFVGFFQLVFARHATFDRNAETLIVIIYPARLHRSSDNGRALHKYELWPGVL
jgi:hypothetical protein